MECKNIYFVRHGESLANKDTRFGLNLSLTENGIEQAIAMADYFRDKLSVSSLILSSVMNRAVETAFRMFPMHNIFLLDRRFREIDFGKLEGTVLNDDILSELQSDPLLIYSKYGGNHVWNRADEALDALRKYLFLPASEIVLVGHDTLFECMLYRSGYYSYRNGSYPVFKLWDKAFRFTNCSVLRIDANFFERKGVLDEKPD